MKIIPAQIYELFNCAKIKGAKINRAKTRDAQQEMRDVLKRWFFQKNALEYDHSCIIRRIDICFPQKYDPILHTENEGSSFSKIYMEI